jgi:hypothetical protein
VAFPKVYTLEWTAPASTGNGKTDFPPSGTGVISLCDPQINPAFYKSALDIIRLANDFFTKSGCRNTQGLSNGYPKEEWVMKLALEFSVEFEHENFALPPDLRMLWITDKDYHPSEKVIPWANRLWVVACQEFPHLDDYEKHDLLTRTEAEQQKLYAASFSDVNKYNDFLVEMFMTFLAHQEVAIHTKQKHLDLQPSNAELDAFFQDPANGKGVTIYDLHRTFYQAQDIQAFLRRVEYFAVFDPNPKQAFGQFEVPEGAYFRKPIPSVDQIKVALYEPMTIPRLFESLAELYEEYANGVGSQHQVLNRLLEIAKPDVTTGNFILKDTPVPNEAEVWEALEDGPLSTIDLAACFPDRVCSIESFTAVIKEMAYYVSPQDFRWIRMFLDEDDEPVGEEQSRKIHALHALLRENPMKVLDWTQRVATWDGETFVDDTPELEADSETEPDIKAEDEPDNVLQIEPEIKPLDVPVVTTPPASPKRKRDIKDDGEEVSGSSPMPRAIKKARRNKSELERCAYPQQC